MMSQRGTGNVSSLQPCTQNSTLPHNMFQQIFTIARNTFIESIRQPVFAVLILGATLLLILNPMISAYTLDDDNKQLLDMGLSTLLLAGVFLAAFTATGVLSEEIENRTVLTVVSKPIARPVFVLGKYFGVVGAIGTAFWVLTVVFLLAYRHKVMQTASDPFDTPVLTFGIVGLLIALVVSIVGNYLYQWIFSSTFVVMFALLETLAWVMVLVVNPEWNFQSPAIDWHPQIMWGLLLIFEGLLIITAVAIAVSTRLGQVMTLVVCFGVALMGMVSDYFLGQRAEESRIAGFFYRIIPNLQLFWPADALTQGNDFTGGYIALLSGYSALVIVAVLAVAVALFQTREVG